MAYPGVALGIGLILAVGIAVLAILRGRPNDVYETNNRPRTRGNVLENESHEKWEEEEVRRRRKTLCSICLDSLVEKACVILAKCDHAYHRSCLETWMKTNSTCPLCRETITKDDICHC